jgi:hypothetical protein
MGRVPFYLLQLPRFYKETGISDIILFLVGLGIVITVFVVVNRAKAKSKSQVFTTGMVDIFKSQGPYKRSALQKTISGSGLNLAQKKMLDFVMKNDNVGDPEYSLHTPELLDRHFKRAYEVILESAKTEKEAQEKLALLYSTRNILEAFTQSSNITSTGEIADKTDAIFMASGKEYPVKVVSSKGKYLVVERPVNAQGSPVPLTNGSKVSLSFFRKSGKAFLVESQVVGLLNKPEGSMVQLLHSNIISNSSKRRFRRRRISLPVIFHFVRLEKTGPRHETKLVVDKRKMDGSLMDISIGGCSILTKMSIPLGTRLKIEFTRGKTTSAALGQVLRTNQSGVNTTMYIKFLKISQSSLNAINTLVFDYAGV